MATNTLAALSKRHCSRYVAFHSAETYFLMTVQILCSKKYLQMRYKVKEPYQINLLVESLHSCCSILWVCDVLALSGECSSLLWHSYQLSYSRSLRLQHALSCLRIFPSDFTDVPPEESRELVLYSGLPLLVGCTRADVIAKSESIWSIEAAVGRKAGASVSVWSLNIPATCWVWKAASDLPFWGKTNTDCRSLHRFGCLGLERAASCSVE